ncbi:MAG TPA: hypothetical protein VLG67_03685 [Candidatus Saccharimonadales bacterium]|nr:hypothetical protein [Candidatus Saccharimonadales bacterium]
MKVKEILYNNLKEGYQKEIESADILQLQNIILEENGNEKKKNYSSSFGQFRSGRRLIIPSFALAALIIIISTIFKVGPFGKIGKIKSFNIIEQVSAQEIVQKATDALKSIDRIHYKIYYGGKAYEKSLTPEESARVGFQGIRPENKTYEFWYDFKKSITRVEIPEYSDALSGKTVIIEKKIDFNDSAMLYAYRADEDTKEGLFQDFQGARSFAYQRTGAFQLNAPESPRKKFEELLTSFKDNKDTKLETVSENGKDYYQLTLHLSYDENSSNIQVTGYKVLIEKETYKPYKETVSYDNGQGTSELTYQEVDSDFEDSIFGPIPPVGYSIAQNLHVKFADRFGKAGPVVLSSCSRDPMIDPKAVVNHAGCTDGVIGTYTPDAELFNDKGLIFSLGNIPVVGLNFKLYKSKQTFDTEYAAKQANQIDYVELKSENGELVFPEIENPAAGTFRKFKLEMYDSKSDKKIDEIETIQEMTVTEAKG